MLILAIVLATHGLTDGANDVPIPEGTGSLSLLFTRNSTVVVMVFLYLFVACYAYSWGPVGWIYPAELYPQRKYGRDKQQWQIHTLFDVIYNPAY
jgi:Sugar (and other) transporter